MQRRYQLVELVGSGGIGQVWKAYDRLTGQGVALKRLWQVAERRLVDTVVLASTEGDDDLSLAREFHTLASLRHPNVIEVYDYGFGSVDGRHNLQPFFTMAWLPAAQSITEAASDQPAIVRFHLIGQLLHGLAYIHRRGIVHRDLKPENVLALADGVVKLVDFGLAVAVNADSANQISGTLPYIAPEIFDGQPASAASDLYAVGLIAYELFAERYPFPVKSLDGLMAAVRAGLVDLEAIRRGLGDVSAIQLLDLQSWISRMMHPDPQRRYPSAEAALEQLAQISRLPLLRDTPSTRESFLKAARFVGRERELLRLVPGLNYIAAPADFTAPAEGVHWLIGGESGVGKSRLLDELRARALVRGALTARGQAAEGGAAYEVWRQILPPLLVEIELDDERAAILAEWLPEVAQWHGRQLPPAPPVTGEVYRQRLAEAIFDAIAQYAAAHPLLLLIEDAQWIADLALIERLAALAGRVIDPALIALGLDARNAPTELVARWLLAASDAGVVEWNDGAWRFVHDKLRESALALLSVEERRAGYARLALAAEALYGDDLTYAGVIAEYWIGTGERQQLIAPTLRATEDYRLRGFYAEAQRLIRAAMEAAPEAVALYVKLAEVQMIQVDYAAARLTLERALDLAAPDDRYGALAQALLAEVWMRHGDLALAEQQARAAQARAESAGWLYEQAKAHSHLAQVLLDRGDPTGAIEQHQLALGLYARVADRREVTQTQVSLALIQLLLGEYAAARAELLAAADSPAARADTRLMTRIQHNLGEAEGMLGAEEAAGERLLLALALDRQTRHERGQALTLAALGWRAERLGDLAEARGYYEEAVAIYERTGFIAGAMVTLLRLGRISDAEEGERIFERAWGVIEQRIGQASWRWLWLLPRLEWQRRRGDLAGWGQTRAEWLSLGVGLLPAHQQALVELIEADWRLRQGEGAAGRAGLEALLARRGRIPAHIAAAAEALLRNAG